MASGLSEEQRLKIEENRRRALALKAARQQHQQQQQPVTAADCDRKSLIVSDCQSAMRTASAGSLAIPQSSACPSSTSTGSTYVRELSSTGCPRTSAMYSSKPASSVSSQSKPCQSTTLADSSNRVPSATDMALGSSARVSVKCCLVSRHKFAADSRYFALLVEVFKSVPSKHYGRNYTSLVSCFVV